MRPEDLERLQDDLAEIPDESVEDAGPEIDAREPLGVYQTDGEAHAALGLRPRRWLNRPVWTADEALKAWAGQQVGKDSADPKSLARPGATVGEDVLVQVWTLVRETQGFEPLEPTLRRVYIEGRAALLWEALSLLAFMRALEAELDGWKPKPRIKPTSRAEEIALIQTEAEKARARRPWRSTRGDATAE